MILTWRMKHHTLKCTIISYRKTWNKMKRSIKRSHFVVVGHWWEVQSVIAHLTQRCHPSWSITASVAAQQSTQKFYVNIKQKRRRRSSAGRPSETRRRNICWIDAAALWEQGATKGDRSHLTVSSHKCQHACVCVSRCYGRGRQWQEILPDSRNQKVLTEWPAGWQAEPLTCSLPHKVHYHWWGQPADWKVRTGWLTDDVCRPSISLGTGCLDDVGAGRWRILMCC